MFLKFWKIGNFGEHGQKAKTTPSTESGSVETKHLVDNVEEIQKNGDVREDGNMSEIGLMKSQEVTKLFSSY